MEHLVGDIWEIARGQDYIVIPTNEGFKKNGDNVMGAGLAKQAADRFPGLPTWYGEVIRTTIQEVGKTPGVILFPKGRLIMFPVKSLDPIAPYMSWKAPADLALIGKSCDQLRSRFGNLPLDKIVPTSVLDDEDPCAILVPLVGCGCGRLQPNVVRPLLENRLGAGPFILVERG